MPLAWSIGVGGALEGRDTECRGLFCFSGSCLDAPIHEEFVMRDVEGICLVDDWTTRLEGFIEGI